MSIRSEFLRDRLRTDDARPFNSDDSAPWWEEGVTVEINQALYLEYLNLLPPRYIDGDLFAFGEGAGNFVLFWSEAKRYFALQLSLEDTETFCRLTYAPRHL